MRSFQSVDDKVEEAAFFCSKIENAKFGEVHHYFSAFIAACRSVTFALQASMKGVEGFEDWYQKWQQQLKSDPLSQFFHQCRTDSQHIGLNPIMGGSSQNGFQVHLFGQPEPNRYSYLPDEDVYTACEKHMRTVCKIIYDCYETFGLVMDPDRAYSAEGLKLRNVSLEDLEEEIGFPRGYTDVPGLDRFEGTREQKRLHVLRSHIPMSTCKRTLAHYLLKKPTQSRN